MADTLESLEIEIKHSASGAADEIKQVSSSVRSLGRALEKVLPSLMMFKNTLNGTAINITSITSNAVNNISNSITKVSNAAKKANTATKSAADGVKKVGDAAKKADNPLKNFVSSLKRIAFYRFIRSVLKAISEAFKEGLENAYRYSQQVGGELAPALDRIASASQKMKNQLGAAFGQLLIALEPVIVFLINIITKLASAISWLIAVITGSDTYLAANDVTKSWLDTEDATKKATKAAKEYENQLLGFDVINRLTEPNNGGGGSDGGGDDYSGLFHEAKVSFDWINPIKDLFAGFVTTIKGAIAELVEAFVFLGVSSWATSSSIQAAFEEITHHIKQSSGESQSTIQAWWSSILSASAEAGMQEIGIVSESLELSQSNMYKFINETLPAWRKWAENIGVMAMQGFVNVSTAVFEGLQNAADNIVTFVNATAQAFWDWATSALHSVVDWANGIVQGVASALSSAWESFKNFMMATGQAVSSWWGENKGWVIPTAIATAVVVSAIALAPVTGGASLGAIALAADGGSFPNEGSLFIAGEAGAEVVANMGSRTGVMNIDQMRDAVRQGVAEAMTANGGNSQVTKLYLNGREIANAVTRDQRNADRAMGAVFA